MKSRPAPAGLFRFCQMFNIGAETAVANTTDSYPILGGEWYAVDNLRCSDSAMALRHGYFIYHGRSDPYSARNCNHSRTGKRHWRAKSLKDSKGNYLNLGMHL
jgi:hypothetical protein